MERIGCLRDSFAGLTHPILNCLRLHNGLEMGRTCRPTRTLRAFNGLCLTLLGGGVVMVDYSVGEACQVCVAKWQFTVIRP